MNIIDQRILIPASPEVIWGIVSTMERNPQWQVNCRDVSFLTTNHQGQGMRYRAVSPKGRDYVVQVSAWYENVGYAYQIVDSNIPFRDNRGRLRLQEVNEGTIVQWVFEYELGGALSGLRNTLGVRRGLEGDIIKSLENLWRVVTDATGSKTYISKSAIREAPDVEARAQYKPRHETKTRQPDEAEIPNLFDEPPIDEGDTRPRPPAQIESVDPFAISAVDNTPPMPEPDFLSNLEQPAPLQSHDIFQPPRTEEDTPAFSRPSDSSAESPPTPPSTKRVEVPAYQSPEASETEQYHLEFIENEPSVTDTSTMSVFDLFGLPKPSETQQMQAVQLIDANTSQTPPPTDSQIIPRVEVASTHQSSTQREKSVGLRVTLRRRNIRIRRRQ